MISSVLLKLEKWFKFLEDMLNDENRDKLPDIVLSILIRFDIKYSSSNKNAPALREKFEKEH